MPPKKAAPIASAPKPPTVDTGTLQRARREASYKMKKAGDTEREKLYAEQWAKGGPNRRLTKKSAPRAQDAKPSEAARNNREAEIVHGMIDRSFNHVDGIDDKYSRSIVRSIFAKDLAKRAEKHGLSSSSAAAMATVASMGLKFT